MAPRTCLWPLSWAALSGLLGCSRAEVEVLDDRPALVASTPVGGAVTQPGPALGPPPQGLKLQLDLHQDPTAAGKMTVLEQGANIRLDAKLINDSDKPISLVLPGDGSYKGWREPRVHFTAEHDDGNGFIAMHANEPIASCGMYDENWQDDVATLAPHTEQAITLWSSPTYFLDFYQPGEYRLSAHYEYAGGQGRLSAGPVPAALQGQPPFALISNPLAFRVEKQLELTLEAIAPVASGEGSELATVLAVKLTNGSAKARTITSPYGGRSSDATLSFSTDGDASEPVLQFNGDAAAIEKTLAAGETLTLLGPGEVFSSRGSHWVVDKPQQVKLRASYQRRGDNYRLRSNWVTVDVR